MVIYVEDNLNNQRLFTKILSKRNLEVEIYDDPTIAYDAIVENKPELIFVDVHLKTRQSGLDLVRRLRQNGVTTPIVVLTAFAMLADRQKAMELGCNDYLSKPYRMEDLLRIVAKFIPEEESN